MKDRTVGLLVVDDEFNIRDGIATAVPWESMNVTVTGVAENGIAALRCVEQTVPDIVITDISMDGMDGLELTARLRAAHPDIKIIILSGYDEFEYAKRAMELKVSTYLLKPVSPDELMEAVKKMIDEIGGEARQRERLMSLEFEVRINREAMLDRLLQDLVNGVVVLRSELGERLSLLEMEMDCQCAACILVAPDGYSDLKERLGPRGMRLLQQRMNRLTEEVLGECGRVWSFPDADGRLGVILCGLLQGRRIRGLAPALEKLRDSVRRLLEITCTIAVGGIVTDILQAPLTWNQAKKALDFRIMTGADAIIQIDDVETLSRTQFRYPHEQERRLLASLPDADETALREVIGAFFEEAGAGGLARDPMRIIVMQLFAAMAGRFMDLGIDIHRVHEPELMDPYKAIERFETVDAIRNWMTNVAVLSANELRERRTSSVKSVVEKAVSFIEARCGDPDLSLNAIADHVYLNPAYLSKLFKQETGENYLEFLTRLRMEKARQLLRETNLRAADIGIRVGYPNAQYFTTLFRKHTGKTPGEYREEK